MVWFSLFSLPLLALVLFFRIVLMILRNWIDQKQTKRKARARYPLADVFRRFTEKTEFHANFAGNKVHLKVQYTKLSPKDLIVYFISFIQQVPSALEAQQKTSSYLAKTYFNSIGRFCRANKPRQRSCCCKCVECVGTSGILSYHWPPQRFCRES